MSAVMTEELIKALSRPFGPEAVKQKRGQGNRMMDYVSHGMVTKRLNDVYPGWHAEMVERWIVGDGDKLHCLGGVMRMTIGGVTREEAGGPTRQGTLADDLKNTYSDCLKRCAMRFGVALDMWESAEENDEDAMPYQKGAEGVGPWDTDTRANRPAQRPTAPQANGSAPRAATPPAPALAPDDPLAGVLATLRGMETRREPWAVIKKYADEQSALADDYGKQTITSTLHGIAARRKAVQAPASIAG